MIVGFMHIPKTGGSKMGYAVEKNPGTIVFAHHRGGAGEAMSFKKYNGTFLFAFVRNPFDRLVSAYSYLKAGGISNEDALDGRRHIEPYDDFEHFVLEGVASGSVLKQVHIMPQSVWVTNEMGKSILDFLGKFENLQDDFKTVCKKLRWKCRKLPISRQSKHKPYREYYGNSDVVKVVQQVYKEDFILGDYSMEV